jgi:hypothetical protein
MNMAGAAAGVGMGATALGGAFSFLSDSRSMTLPRAGEVIGDTMSVAPYFDDLKIDDWRVRLSLPLWPSFRYTNAVLQPLLDAGGMIFPYTPSITIHSNASYTAMQPVHSNYKFNAYQHSDPGTITITAPMNVEDQEQALYWIAALHYFRSVTKMFSGNDPKAGNPPPIVKLNAYGSYVFNNVPVAVTSFQTTLDAQCDYIPVATHTSMVGKVNSLAEGIGGLAGALGGAFGMQKATSKLTDITEGVSKVATLANAMGLGFDAEGGIAYVPTRSQFTVNLTPMYSRTTARKFSLDNFVTGSYLNNNTGYI